MPRTFVSASLGLAGLALSGCVAAPPPGVAPYDTAYGGPYADAYSVEPAYSDPYYYGDSYGYTPYPVVGSSIYFNYVDRDYHRHRGHGHRSRGNRAERRAERRDRRRDRFEGLSREERRALRQERRERRAGLSREERRAARQERRAERGGGGRGNGERRRGGNRGGEGRRGGNRGNPATVRRVEPLPEIYSRGSGVLRDMVENIK